MSKDLTPTYANIAANNTPKGGEPQQDKAEQISATEQVSTTNSDLEYRKRQG